MTIDILDFVEQHGYLADTQTHLTLYGGARQATTVPRYFLRGNVDRFDPRMGNGGPDPTSPPIFPRQGCRPFRAGNHGGFQSGALPRAITSRPFRAAKIQRLARRHERQCAGLMVLKSNPGRCPGLSYRALSGRPKSNASRTATGGST